MNRTTTLFTIAGVTVVGGLVAYALYFDYKRRNDVDFRKKLRMSYLFVRVSWQATDHRLVSVAAGKEKKKVSKQVAEQKAPANTVLVVSEDELRAALQKIRTEPSPNGVEENEAYFTSHLNLGDQLVIQGIQMFFSLVMESRAD